jgi:hypothetical protein
MTQCKLTKENAKDFGHHRNVIADLIKRGAVVIDGTIYAPIKKRVRGDNALTLKNKGL